jgi:L-seryl-tRNA(Ser) seleniumtransferase
VPVLVDAAAQLPPAANLRDFLAQGASLVAFSGGKAIGGPQASGILCGRMDLVSSALLQMLDLDVQPDAWSPPTEFAPLAQLRGLPHHGIGRSCKAGKEEIVGLLTALESFVVERPEVRHLRWAAVSRSIMNACGAVEGLTLTLLDEPERYSVPMLRVEVHGGRPAAASIAVALEAGIPPIHCQTGRLEEGVLLFSPVALAPEDGPVIGRRLREAAAHTAASAVRRPMP